MSDFLVKMGARVSLFKLLLFQLFVAWCGSKHVAYAAPPQPPRAGVDETTGHIQRSFSELLHTGKYSSEHLDASQAEVVVPLKVSREGQFLSHDLEHRHEHERTKRSASANEHTLHYNITVEGRDLRLDLRPSPSFMIPALVVETRHANGHRTQSAPSTKAVGCHYHGSVRGQPDSSVAVSACDGIAGLLRTEHGEYWIEPSNRVASQLDSTQGHAHVVYKRSAISDHHRTARAINSDTSSGNKQSFDKRRVHNKAYLEKKRRNQLQRTYKNGIPYKQSFLELQKDKSSLEQRKAMPQRRVTSLRRHGVNGTYSVKEANMKSIETIENSGNLPAKNLRKKKQGLRKKGKGRKRRRKKNCATKEPPISSAKYIHSVPLYNNYSMDPYVNNRTHLRHALHHHMLSQRAGFPPPLRRARSVSRPHHVEVLLVADYTMFDFHKHDTDTYLLTVMNMVSRLYLDHTIGNFINVVVVKIIIIDDPGSEKTLNVTSNSDETLENFCRWQKRQNMDDDAHRHHHDVAIFVTRLNLCGKNDSSCSTLGVAHVAGMCQPDRSCSVNEDNGLSLAHTITHELGHNFGLYHDTEQIGCMRRVGSTLHIMTPVFEADTVKVAWSRCSRRDVTNFLDAGMAECLTDEPSNSSKLFDYIQLPEGEMFDASSQCRLVYGAGVHEVCNDALNTICEHLWCNVNNTCKSNLRGAVSGTPCGPEMWCQNQKCVPKRPPAPPQDGGWGEWSDWSECSRTCGGGVSTQKRQCDSPVPERGGKFCIGERTRYRICNTDTCVNTKPSFRQQQCYKYGNDFVPTIDQEEPCALLCSKMNEAPPDLPKEYVADGTPCKVGANDMCISGICRTVGCDWVVDSTAEVDACGVCNGDGVECEMVHGIYSKDTTKESGYSEVAVIPAGSRNVKVEELANSKNYIGVGSAKSRKFYLNGRRNINLAGEYFVAGSPAVYERDQEWEKVHIPGPIKEDIKIYQMLYRGKHRNPGVTYQYTIDRTPPRPARYWWKIAGWGACSRSCGGGVTRQRVDCIDERNHVVDAESCISEPELQKPPELVQHCNMAACPSHAYTQTHAQTKTNTQTRQQTSAHPRSRALPATHWWVGQWSACSHICKHDWGTSPVRRRDVYCVEKTNNQVTHSSRCDDSIKPTSQIPCVGLPLCSARFRT